LRNLAELRAAPGLPCARGEWHRGYSTTEERDELTPLKSIG